MRITINTHRRYQSMEGFGVSGAWWAQDIGTWPEPDLTRLLRVLFDPQEGIGLTIYRYNIGADGGPEISDPWRRAQSFYDERGQYDWTRDRAARRVLSAALQAGARDVVAFACSPPASMTISGRSSGNDDGRSNLSPNRVSDFVRYLVDVVGHLRSEGVPIRWLSPVNEPQWEWQAKNGQEGAHYTPQEVADVVRAVVRALQEAELPEVTLSAPESGQWKGSEEWVAPLLDDPEIGPALSHISLHSYWSTPADKVRFAAYMASRWPGQKLWMSEWTEMRGGRDLGMDSALVLAQTVLEDLTLGCVTSWQYWIAVSQYAYRDGLVYVDAGQPGVIPTKRLWSLGQFSRFVRPGSVRVAAESDDPDVSVIAFTTDQGVVAVVINRSPVTKPYDLHAVGHGPVQTVRQFVTNAEMDLAEYVGGLPSASVSTLILADP